MHQEIIEVETDAVVTLPKAQMTKTKLSIPENTSFDEWKNIGRQLKGVEGAIQFWVGDWINFGERKFGDKYLIAMAQTGFSYEYLKTIAWVSKRFNGSSGTTNEGLATRHENLSFTHHQAVAALPGLVAEKLLDKAVTDRLTREELKAEVREWQAEHNPQKAQEHKERPFSLAQEAYVISYVDDIMDIKLRTNKLLQETRDPVVRKYYLEMGGKVLVEILDLLKKYPEIDL